MRLSDRVRVLLTACLAASLNAPFCRAEEGPKVKDGDLVVISGDSITVQHLYSVYVETYLLMCTGKRDLGVMQLGYHGEVAWAFAFRVKQDVRPFHPNVVMTCYGMNDGGYMGLTPVTAPSFKEGTQAYLKQLKEDGVRTILLGSPTVVDTDAFKGDPAEVNHTLKVLRDTAEAAAGEEGVQFVDLHTPMMKAMGQMKAKYGKQFPFAGPDGFHPVPAGHVVMAHAFLKALGCDGDIGTITFDLGSGNAEATEGHRVVAASKSESGGRVEVESSRYPFCFFGEPSSEDSTRGVIEFVPFNEELNRFRLVVRGAEGRRVRVTWGGAAKEFDGEALARGINLAAEFVGANPFQVHHKSVEYAVKQQQDYETALVRDLKSAMEDLKRLLPEEKELQAKMEAAVMGKLKRLREDSANAVKPVRHEIEIRLVDEAAVDGPEAAG